MTIADAMDPGAASPPQLALFEALPEAPSHRRPRRARGGAVETIVLPRPAPIVIREAFDPQTLTNSELRSLVQVLDDDRLGYLLTEAAREARRRLAPSTSDPTDSQPDPCLIRAARVTVGELGSRGV